MAKQSQYEKQESSQAETQWFDWQLSCIAEKQSN